MLEQFIVITIIMTLGATLQGSIGLGLGFVAVPLLAIIDTAYLPGPLLLAALILTLLMTAREHKSIRFKGIEWAIAGRIIGSLFGIQILIFMPDRYLAVLFASVVIIGVLLSISGLKLELTSRNLFGAATLSGLMGTSAAIGGPPLALIYQHLDGPSLRGTLSGIFVIGTMISVILLSLTGRFGVPEIKMAMLMVPGILTGFFLSSITAKTLDRGFIRPVVLVFSMLSGIVLIFRVVF